MKDLLLTSATFFNHTESGEAAFVSGRHMHNEWNWWKCIMYCMYNESNECKGCPGSTAANIFQANWSCSLCFLFYFGNTCLVLFPHVLSSFPSVLHLRLVVFPCVFKHLSFLPVVARSSERCSSFSLRVTELLPVFSPSLFCLPFWTPLPVSLLACVLA